MFGRKKKTNLMAEHEAEALDPQQPRLSPRSPSEAIKPSLAFYFKVPLDVALGRILGGRDALKYYEAGMDLGLSRNIEESFRIFQGRILEEYESMIEEMGFHVIDATKSIETQQKEMRRIVVQEFGRTRPPGVLGTEVRVAELQG